MIDRDKDYDSQFLGCLSDFPGTADQLTDQIMNISYGEPKEKIATIGVKLFEFYISPAYIWVQLLQTIYGESGDRSFLAVEIDRVNRNIKYLELLGISIITN